MRKFYFLKLKKFQLKEVPIKRSDPDPFFIRIHGSRSVSKLYGFDPLDPLLQFRKIKLIKGLFKLDFAHFKLAYGMKILFNNKIVMYGMYGQWTPSLKLKWKHLMSSTHAVLIFRKDRFLDEQAKRWSTCQFLSFRNLRSDSPISWAVQYLHSPRSISEFSSSYHTLLRRVPENSKLTLSLSLSIRSS